MCAYVATAFENDAYDQMKRRGHNALPYARRSASKRRKRHATANHHLEWTSWRAHGRACEQTEERPYRTACRGGGRQSRAQQTPFHHRSFFLPSSLRPRPLVSRLLGPPSFFSPPPLPCPASTISPLAPLLNSSAQRVVRWANAAYHGGERRLEQWHSWRAPQLKTPYRNRTEGTSASPLSNSGGLFRKPN